MLTRARNFDTENLRKLLDRHGPEFFTLRILFDELGKVNKSFDLAIEKILR